MSNDLVGLVAKRLREEQVPFALIGASALAAHGVTRSTYDTDLFAASRRALEPEVWGGIQALGVQVDIRVGDHDDPLLGVVRFVSSDQAVDLVLGSYLWQRAILERASTSNVMGLELPLVQAGDLILLKLYAGGIQDRWDIAQLLANDQASDMVQQVELRLHELPAHCTELWGQIRSAG